MKCYIKNFAIAYLLSVALSMPAEADLVSLATAPLATSTTSTVKPNVMFILDNSGSMGWDYLPDWANDSHPVTGTGYSSMPELFKNGGFNGVAYNPGINYKPPILYNADGTLNTTTYPSQTGAATASGADSTAKPNWKAVKDDAYGIQSTSISNLVGNASFYTFVPGEYCSSSNMTSCITATAPTTVSGVLYDKPAGLRWCNSAALTACQSINNSTYNYPRYPGYVKAATATITVTGGGTATSIKVNGFEILSAATSASTTTSTVASRIVTNINTCTAAISGSCTIAGYSAARSNNVVAITAPVSLGAITFTPVALGTMSKTITAFSGSLVVPGSNQLTNIVSTTTSYPYPGTTTKASTRTDCAGDTCSYNEEMTNYANWWTYYHTRMQAMKTSVSRAFQTLDSRFRVGFSTITETGVADGAMFLGNNTFELAHKNNWYTKLFAQGTPGYTPLRGALSKAGRYYAKRYTGQIDPVQYSCQQNFTILSTDGYWNTNAETSTYKNIDLSGGLIGDMDASPIARPMYEGPTASSGSLADVAKYYYDTDLRTSALGNCAGGISTDFPSGNQDVCTNNVFVSSSDNNLQQHMTTFTMGLGADGTLNYTTDYLTATSGDYYNLKNGLGTPTANWSEPINNTAGERIDDLWHAAVNGKGLYFSAKNPDQIVSGFNTALSSLTAKLGSAAAAATSTLNPVAGNNTAFVASYTTVKWTGNLEARSVNIDTGVVSETATWCVENITASTCASPGTVVANTSGSSTIYNCVVSGTTLSTCASPGVFNASTSTCSTEIANSCSGTMPGKVGAASDTRTIYTAPAGGLTPISGKNLVMFDTAYAAANPTNFAAAHISTLTQWPALTVSQQTAAAGANLVNFLRGQNGYEDRTANTSANRLYRIREAVMGDPLESQPAFLSNPVFSYPYPGYSSYKAAQAARAGRVYIGVNDGMMHSFAADTGIESWAYVPSMVVTNLWKLADSNYAVNHFNSINGSPITSDVCTANCSDAATAVWKTILVAGLNGGGRGYYALDITNPAAPILLWEFTTTAGIGAVRDDDLGYTFGLPVITKKVDGTWVVLVSSGYNNASPGSGIGYLYVLNAGTGAIISKISTGVGNTGTPSGLAKISGWNNEPVGNMAGYVYGGDLLGNVWRFDINSTVAATVGTGDKLKFATLFSDTAGTIPQPITTTPILGKILGKRVIFIGTGKYLETSDLTTTQVQSIYAIKDDDATSTFVNPRTSSTMVNQTLTAATNTATRTASGNAVDFGSKRGWYVDFPESGERVNVDGKLVQGNLLIPTVVPSSTICSPGGHGWLNSFNYMTGGAINTTTNLASVKYDAVIVGFNILYIHGIPKVEIITSNNPTPEINTSVGFLSSSPPFTGKRVIWRELLQ